MRCTGDWMSRSSRSTESARWAPRFVPATACTSSRISVSTVRSISRAWDVRMRKSDSGVVIRMSGGLRAICWRSFCGVSPVRTATLARADPGQRPAEVALDVVVQRLERRYVEQAQTFSRARVQPVDAVEEGGERLPEPVGAWMRTLPPFAMAGQPSTWAGVGSANAPSNQARVLSPNSSSALTRPD